MSKKLSEQVAELEDRLQREEAEAIFWERQYRESHAHWENWVDELKGKCDRLRAENTEHRAGRGRWPKAEEALKAIAATLATIRQGSPEPDDDFPCCTDTPPRLTVHKLNVAPVGTVAVSPPGSSFTLMRKAHSGKWVTIGDELTNTGVEWSSEYLIEYGWADATLHLPEDQS